MNKLTKLGIVTFSAVTLSAVVPTLVHAEENVAPQPNAAARPTIQPTLTPKPNNNWVDYSMLDPIAKPKPKPGKEVSKPADSNKNETPTDETTGKSASKPKEELKSVDEKTRLAELKTKYDVDPSNKEIDTTLTMSAAEIVKGLNTEEDKKRTETLAAAGVASSIVEHDAIVFEETRKVFLSTGVDITKPPFTKSNPNDPYEAVAAVATYPEPKYIIKAIYMDAAKLKKFGYTEKAHVSDITPSELSYPNGEKFEGGYTLVDSYNHHINSVQEGSNIKLVGTKWDYDEIQRNSNAHIKELVAPEIKGYTFSHVEKARDLPDLSTDPRVVKVDYESIYHMHGGKSVLDSSFYLDILHYYFIYNKDEIAKEIPNPEINNTKPAEDTTLKPAEQPASNPVANTQPTANPTPTLKPTENPQPEVKPVDQPQPAKPVEPAEKPSIPEKPATPAKPEVKPAEQPQPTKPVDPAENAGLPKVPYRNDQPKRWFNNGTGRPTLTTNDLAVPLPAENVEKTSYGWWTAEPDLLHADSHIKVNTFNSNFNNPMFENGKEIKFKGSGFGDMDSRFKPALVRVKVPELEGMNYEAYTIFYEVPNKNGNPTYGTNRTLQGGGIFLNIKSKEKKEDIQVYTLTKDKKLEELYYPGYPSEETNRYDEKTKTHSYNLFGETYDTYVFLFKNPVEKPAEQVKPEVKPSEQPKPVENKPVENKPAETPVPAPKPAENPQPEVKPEEQPQPAKPVQPVEKPSEQPVNPVTPVAPITPTTSVAPTLNPAIPNNTRVLSNKAGSVQVHGSEATLKNVSYIKVEETKSTSLESKDYKAFDIHLYDANGKAIQPNGMVLVSLSADKPVENVYYVAPDGTLQALKFKQDTDKVTFETNHFSIYAVTFKVAASRDNGGATTPVPVVNSSNTPKTTEQKGNDASSTKTQAEPLATKTETISKQVAKTLPNTGENHSILATLFGMLTLTAGLFSLRKESE
jgi:LPXTG-motif cell wall anchor domain protein